MGFNLPFFPLISFLTILGISRMARIVIASSEKKIAALKPQARFLEMPYINKVGNCLVLLPETNPWQGMQQACEEFSDDFLSDVEVLQAEEREWPA